MKKDVQCVVMIGLLLKKDMKENDVQLGKLVNMIINLVVYPMFDLKFREKVNKEVQKDTPLSVASQSNGEMSHGK